MKQTGNILSIVQGETLLIEAMAKTEDGLPEMAIDTAEFYMSQEDTVTTHTTVIDAPYIRIEFPQSETIVMLGEYKFECWVKGSDGVVLPPIIGTIAVDTSAKKTVI